MLMQKIDMQDREMTKEQYKEIVEALKESEAEIERGEGIDSDQFFKELKQKYAY
jgi:hypothetical protein